VRGRSTRSLRFTRCLILVAGVCFAALALTSCLQPNPDAVALKRIKEAFKADPMLMNEELTVTVKDRFATVTGEVGSRLYPEKITQILQKLKTEGVIENFNNAVTVLDIENPLFQDYTAPIF